MPNDDNLSKAELQLIDKIVDVLSLTKFRHLLWDKIRQAFGLSFQGTQLEYGFVRGVPDPLALKYLEDRVFILSDKTQSLLRGNLRWELLEGMKNVESVDEIKRRLDKIFEGNIVNTERIARTEVLNAMAEGRYQANVQSGVANYKQWKAAMNNSRTASDSKWLNGQIQKIEDPFFYKDGSTFMHNPNRPNCRCAVLYLRKLPENIVYKGGQMYDSSEMVGKIEIDLGSLNKAEKHYEYVTVHPKKGKPFKRRQLVGKKDVGEKSKEDLQQKITKTVTDYEMKIRDRDSEFCGAVNESGDMIFTKGGEVDRIEFNEEEMLKFKGTIFTHNHPKGCSLSDADILCACKSGMKEVRAISRESGKTYTMRLKNGENFSRDMWVNKIGNIYMAAYTEIQEGYEQNIRDGVLSVEEANHQHWNEVWTRVATNVPELEYIGD